MKIGAIGIRTKIIVGDAATWHLVKKYIDGKIIDLATDYETLNNKPKINDVELSGNKTSEDLGLVSAVEGKSLVDDLEIAKLAAVFTNLNIKIAENATDILSIKNDIEEHKSKNKDDMKELKDAIIRDKTDNREDHMKIVGDLATVNKNIADLRVDIIKAIKGK